jgi:hypothetical protein
MLTRTLSFIPFRRCACLTAACQSGGRVTVICVRKILRICDPQIGNLTMERWRMELATAAGCFQFGNLSSLAAVSMSQRRSLRYVPGISPHRSKLMNTLLRTS